VPPGGDSDTLPEPTLLTESVTCDATKVAVTDLSASSVNVVGFALPDRSPLQPENV
jgi:hypothetical protein